MHSRVASWLAFFVLMAAVAFGWVGQIQLLEETRMERLAFCAIFLSIVGVSCGSPLGGNAPIPTQTPRIIVVTATPDSAQVAVPGRRTNTPTVPTAIVSSTPLPPTSNPTPPATRGQTPSVVPTPLAQSCSGKPQDVGKIALHIFNHNGGTAPIDFRIDEGEKVTILPKVDDQPGFSCVDVMPGFHRWSATMFRGGTVYGTIEVVPGRSLAPINFCWDWDDNKLTDRCTGIPAFVPTPTPTGCCAMVYPNPYEGLLAFKR